MAPQQAFQGFNMLNYSKFSMIIPAKDAEHTLDILHSIQPESVTTMQRELDRVKPLFSYGHCARDMVIEAIARRAAQHPPGDQAVQTKTQPISALDSEPEFPIDAVFTWVNGSTLRHQHNRHVAWKFVWQSGRSHILAGDAQGGNRFTDHNELRFALRSVYMNIPWVRKIFVVTADQIPSWFRDVTDSLSGTGPEVVLVSHTQIFDPSLKASALPTFNSIGIEAYLHRIPSLSERWILLNDDFFVGKPLSKLAFFTPEGLPKVSFQYNWGYIPKDSPTGKRAKMGYMWATHNTDRLLDAKFGRELRFRIMHQAIPMTTGLMKLAHQLFPHAVRATAQNQFRSENDVLTYYLAAWIGIYQNSAVRLTPDQHLSNILINMKEDNGLNRMALTRLLSPCLPSIQRLACEKSGNSLCQTKLYHADRVVFDPVRGECRRPLRTLDGFATLQTLRQCSEECINRNVSIDTLKRPGEGHISLFCIGDMTNTIDDVTLREQNDLMLSFFLLVLWRGGDTAPALGETGWHLRKRPPFHLTTNHLISVNVEMKNMDTCKCSKWFSKSSKPHPTKLWLNFTWKTRFF